MGRNWLAALAMLAACGSQDDAATTPLSSCETTQTFVYGTSPLDVLFLIDARAPELATFDANARALMTEIMSRLTETDAHVAVAGAPAGCLREGQEVLTWHPRPSGDAVTNFDGRPEDAFTCMTHVTGGDDALARLAGALAIPGFRRGGPLFVIAIATDATTSAEVATARSLLPTDDFVAVSAIAPLAAAASWQEIVTREGGFAVLESSDWSPALWRQLQASQGSPCLPAAVAHPEQCVFIEHTPGAEVVVPYCPGGDGPRPCWWTESASNLCLADYPTLIHFERAEFPTTSTFDDFRCPTSCN